MLAKRRGKLPVRPTKSSLGLAFIQYQQDFDETYPTGGINSLNAGLACGWAGQIYPYVKSTAVFACPDEPSVIPTSSAPGYNIVSYAYNADLHHSYLGVGAGLAVDPMFGQPYITGKLNSPTLTVLLCEVQDSRSGQTAQEGVTLTVPSTELYSPAATGGYDPASGPATYTEGSGNAGANYATGSLAG